MNGIALAAHVLSAVVWVGGMFFAYVVLRPSLMALEGPARLSVWAGVFKRFFPWVWLTILVLFVSGFMLLFGVYGGMAAAPLFVHIMILLAFLMLALFCYLYLLPYKNFKSQVHAQDWPAAAGSLDGVRKVVLTNLVLGICVVFVGSSGRYLSIW